jgi:hypothetical protein
VGFGNASHSVISTMHGSSTALSPSSVMASHPFRSATDIGADAPRLPRCLVSCDTANTSPAQSVERAMLPGVATN